MSVVTIFALAINSMSFALNTVACLIEFRNGRGVPFSNAMFAGSGLVLMITSAIQLLTA